MAERKLRMLFNSNAPWATSGYSMQMAELLPRITKLGYSVAQNDFFGLQGGKLEVNGVTHYPTINHVYGSDAMVLHGKDFKADVVFTLQDIWVLHPDDLAKTNHWIPILPIDQDPVPNNVLDKLRFAYKVITYAKFGQKQLLDKGIFSTYIPHTVDTKIYKPMDKVKRKQAAGLPTDCFLVGMVAANKDNPPRKSFQEVMDSFKMFLAVEPKAILYIHTNPQFPGGFPIDEYARFIGIQDRVIFPDAYQMNYNMGKSEMAMVYNTFDVLMAPSASEGFCVPLIEAQACGVPVITNRFTSMEELCLHEKTGYLCDVGYKRFVASGSYWGIPSVQSIFDNLVSIHKRNTIEMGKEARKFMVENFDSDTVFKEKWVPYFEDLENELVPKENKGV